MSTLSLFLPPFASDCAGACAALYGCGLPVLLLGSRCCITGYAQGDEPRWERDRQPVVGAPLYDSDVVFGGVDAVAAYVTEAAERFAAPAVVLVGSPVPAMAGFDLAGMGREVLARTGIAVITVATTGCASYERGIERALFALVEHGCDCVPALRDAGERHPCVGLVGATPLDWGQADYAWFEECLQREGIAVGVRLGMGGRWEDAAHVLGVDCNIALSMAGARVARRVEKRWGIPWFAADVAGEEGVGRTVERIRGCAAQGDLPRGPAGEMAEGPRVLVVGDQVHANSLRRAYEGAHPGAFVRVGSFFGLERGLRRPCDVVFADDWACVQHVRTGAYGLVVGDPLLKELMDQYGDLDGQAPRFESWPHGAVSGTLYAERVARRCMLCDLVRLWEHP